MFCEGQYINYQRYHVYWVILKVQFVLKPVREWYAVNSATVAVDCLAFPFKGSADNQDPKKESLYSD